jgi:hypothetical protein
VGGGALKLRPLRIETGGAHRGNDRVCAFVALSNQAPDVLF